MCTECAVAVVSGYQQRAGKMTEVESGARSKLTREDLDIIKEALLEAAEGDVFQQLIQTKVSETVAEAMAGGKEEIRELRVELDDTKTRLNELEKCSRRLCLNVTGVP